MTPHALGSDCAPSGCRGQVCSSEPVFTTCEFVSCYACFQDPSVTRCVCDNGKCKWTNHAGRLARCHTSSSGDTGVVF